MLFLPSLPIQFKNKGLGAPPLSHYVLNPQVRQERKGWISTHKKNQVEENWKAFVHFKGTAVGSKWR